MTSWVVLATVVGVVVAVFHFLLSATEHRKPRVATALVGAMILFFVVLIYYRDGLRRVFSGESANSTVVSPQPSNPALNPTSASNRPIEVSSRQEWTPTNVIVEKGQTVTVKATGEVRFSDHDPLTGPDGEGKPCYPNPKIYRWTFPAQDLSCHSLLGRIGEEGTVFEIGSFRRFRADLSGRFYLGVNDNWFPDNSGSWWADVSVSAVQQADMH